MYPGNSTPGIPGWNHDSTLFFEKAKRLMNSFLIWFQHAAEKKNRVLIPAVHKNAETCWSDPGRVKTVEIPAILSNSQTLPVRERICLEKKIQANIETMYTAASSRRNSFVITGKETHTVLVNNKMLGIVLKNLLSFINERNIAQEIEIRILDDADYIILVAEYQGNYMNCREIRQLYQANPALITNPSDSLLYSCLHILKATGGWLTAGQKNNKNSYLTLGLPRN